MKTKLVQRIPQTADRFDEFQLGIEAELRRRLQLAFGDGLRAGIVSSADVDSDTSPCALSVNVLDSTRVDVRAGTVVFKNGEYVDVSSTDLQSVAMATTTDANILRIEYGEVGDGPVVANTYYNFAAQPKVVKRAPSASLVVESITSYNAQSQAVKDLSVVIGVAQFEGSELVVDNTRETHSFSRPWATVVDSEHRSLVGSGTVTATNPHGTSANDLTVGAFTLWQALVDLRPRVVARPRGTVPKIPGEVCTETLPAGNFLTDGTGFITGKTGALYTYIGKWPDRLVACHLPAPANTPIAGWIVPGTQILAVYDPVNFAVAADLYVEYGWVQAGSAPDSFVGLNKLTFQQPADGEILVSGGNFFTALAEPTVLFSDVGVIPMPFDVRVDSAGKVYKTPQVVFCNKTLASMGATPTPFESQPIAPSFLRVAISNYNPGLTRVKLQITGKDKTGASLTKLYTFNGPLPAANVSPVENTSLRQFSLEEWAECTNVQVIERINDGPNTTCTVFAELTPSSEQPAGDHLPLARVHWTGADISRDYVNNPAVALDLRQVTTGGGPKQLLDHQAEADLASTVMLGHFGYPFPDQRAVWVEDFDNPHWADGDTTALTVNNRDDQHFDGGRMLTYTTRKLPTVLTILNDPTTMFQARLIPRLSARTTPVPPNRVMPTAASFTFYLVSGASVTVNATVTGRYPPWLMQFNAGNVSTLNAAGSSIYAVRAQFTFPQRDLAFWQGFSMFLSEPVSL